MMLLIPKKANGCKIWVAPDMLSQIADAVARMVQSKYVLYAQDCNIPNGIMYYFLET